MQEEKDTSKGKGDNNEKPEASASPTPRTPTPDLSLPEQESSLKTSLKSESDTEQFHANAISSDIPLSSPHKSPNSNKLVSKLSGSEQSPSYAEEESHSADTSLVTRLLTQSPSPTKKLSSKHKSSSAEKKSNGNERKLSWFRSSSSSPSKRSNKPFHEPVFLETFFRNPDPRECQSSDGEQPKDIETMGACSIEHLADELPLSNHGSPVSERPFHESTESDHFLARTQCQQFGESASERTCSNNVPDSEMGASRPQGLEVLSPQLRALLADRTPNQNNLPSDNCFTSKMRSFVDYGTPIWEFPKSAFVPTSEMATLSVDSVSETEESRIDREAREAQNRRDLERQADEFVEQQRTPYPTDSSSDDDTSNNIQSERMNKVQRRKK